MGITYDERLGCEDYDERYDASLFVRTIPVGDRYPSWVVPQLLETDYCGCPLGDFAIIDGVWQSTNREILRQEACRGYVYRQEKCKLCGRVYQLELE